MEHPLDHLDAVARKPNDAFYVISRVVLRQPEDDNITARRRRRPDTAGKQGRRQRQGIVAVTVRVLGYEEIITDQEGRLHRARRNIEWLKKERANHKCDDERVKDDASGLGNTAFFS